MTEIPLEVLEDSAWEAGFEDQSIWKWTYNGRFYAKDCFGVVGSIGEFGQFLLEVARHPNGGRDYANALTETVTTDNMGSDLIFYFPGIKELVEDEDDDHS